MVAIVKRWSNMDIIKIAEGGHERGGEGQWQSKNPRQRDIRRGAEDS